MPSVTGDADDSPRAGNGRERQTVLLHVCCAPCATAAIERLQLDYDVVLFWYNPNITDADEYQKRLDEFLRYADRIGLHFVVAPYDVDEWWRAVQGLEGEPEGGRRCAVCFRLRLDTVARAAQAAGIPLFTTTLTISPHKSFAQVREAGNEAASAHRARFLPVDFKKQGGFERSAQLADDHGLYRQDYCGCEFSKRERDARQRRRESRKPR